MSKNSHQYQNAGQIDVLLLPLEMLQSPFSYGYLETFSGKLVNAKRLN